MRPSIGHLALAVVIATPSGHAACQQLSATIPTELALALLDGNQDAYGSRSPKIAVGVAPEGIPASLSSAARATVLGGMTESRGVIVVLKSTLPPNQVLAAFDKQLTGAGWAPPPPPESERGGFVSSPYTGSWGNFYCGDSGTAVVSYSPAPQGGTYLKVRYGREKQSSFCAPQRMASFQGPSLTFPALLPPPGMSQSGGRGGSGSDRTEISARLTGPLGPAELVAHYLKQLEAAGWTMGPLVTSGEVSLASARATDPERTQWNGALVAQRISAYELEVTIEMSRPSER